VTSQHTAPVLIGGVGDEIALTDEWGEGPRWTSALGNVVGRVARPLALAVVLAASPATAGLDLWLVDPRRLTSSVFGTLRTVTSRRRITWIEARQIALAGLMHAERERLRAADEEAARGLQWEIGQ